MTPYDSLVTGDIWYALPQTGSGFVLFVFLEGRMWVGSK